MESKAKAVALAGKYFKRLISGNRGDYWAQKITNLVRESTVSWQDLQFTEVELAKERRAASIRGAENYFATLKSSTSRQSAGLIETLINSGEVDWSDLSFTEADVMQELRKVIGRQLGEQLKEGNPRYFMERLRMFFDRGEVDWKDLPFTKEAVEACQDQLRTEIAVRKAEYLFNSLAYTPSYSSEVILNLVQGGQVSWKDLPFTEEGLAQRVKICHIQTAEAAFVSMASGMVETNPQKISALIQKGEVSWNDLSFTELQFVNRECALFARIAENLFSHMQTVRSENYKGRILSLIARRKTYWKDLTFDETDLKQLEQDNLKVSKKRY